MPNELLLILSLLITFSFVLAAFYFFKEQGLFLWTTIATIAANIEVLIIVNAFGMEMTLGNILFASTFLVTDILSELYGKKRGSKSRLFRDCYLCHFYLYQPVLAALYTESE